MRSSSRNLILMLALGLLLVFGIVVFLLIASPKSSENALPTLVAFATLRPTETAVVPSPEPEPTETGTAIPTDTSSPEVLEQATASQTPLFVASATSQNSNPRSTVTLSSSAQATATTLVQNPPIPTASPVVNIAATLPVVATLDPSALVPFNQAIDIGGGDLRVLSMTAPADEVILSLGGSIPSIQANQQWILIELFLICETAETNCTPPASSFALESSLNSYAITSLNIESAFGSLFFKGQSLGHLAFVIPRTETAFALELSKDGQVFRFALR